MFVQKFPGKVLAVIALFSLGFWFAVGPGRALLGGQSLLLAIESSSRWREVIFVGLFATLSALGFPGTALAVAGGLVFGILWGTIWSVVGATLGAVVSFWLARYLLHDWAHRRWRDRPLLERCCTEIARRPLRIVLALRLMPVAPFGLVSCLFGLTKIGWWPYTFGTFVGILPGTLAFVWLGVAGRAIVREGDWRPLAIVVALLALLSALPLLWGGARRDRCGD